MGIGENVCILQLEHFALVLSPLPFVDVDNQYKLYRLNYQHLSESGLNIHTRYCS